MSTSAEITCTIQNDHQSIMFRVSAQGEGNSTPNLRGMLCQIQTAITEFQKKPPTKLLSNTERKQIVSKSQAKYTPSNWGCQARFCPDDQPFLYPAITNSLYPCCYILTTGISPL